jgi:beta-lactamase regulating signal transducer with metallopeptidase domain
MPLVELLAHPLARLITLTLLHFLWQGAAIAVLLAAIVEVGRIRSAQRRYNCSLAALAMVIVIPLATFGWFVAQSSDAVLPAELLPTRQQTALSVAPRTQSAEFLVQSYSPKWLDTVQPYVFAVWLVGVGLLAARLAAGAMGVWRLRQSSYPLPPQLAEMAGRLGRRMGFGGEWTRRAPLVALSRRVSEAVALGIVRPLVLLPAAWVSEMPLPMLEAVIAHELAHLARRDLLVNLLQRIVETLLFYHPAVWWLSRRLRIERELCCDEQAIAATGRRLEYVQALAHVAQRGARVELQLAAGIRGEDHMQLLQRVRNVLGASGAERPSRLWPAGLAALAAPVALWLLSIGLGAAAADEERVGDAPREKEREERFERNGDRPGGEREVERPDREGARPEKERDNPEAAAAKRAREEKLRFLGNVEGGRRDAGRPAKEGPRDGDRPVKEGARDGQRPAKVVERADKVPPRTDKEVARDGDRPLKQYADKESDAGRVAELSAMVKRLMAENQKLRRELAAIRESGPAKETKQRDAQNPLSEKEAAQRERKQRLAAELKEATQREMLARERKLDALRNEQGAEARERAAAEREKASADKRAAMERERSELAERKRAEERQRAEATERKRVEERRETERKQDDSK